MHLTNDLEKWKDKTNKDHRMGTNLQSPRLKHSFLVKHEADNKNQWGCIWMNILTAK